MDLLSVHDISEPSPVSDPQAVGSSEDGGGQSVLATPTLDQELADFKKTLGGVGASLGGWWGKVQKQSASALTASGLTAQIDTARKDLASLNLLEKAKKEATRLGEQAREGYATVAAELEKGPDADDGQPGGAVIGVDGSVIPTLPIEEKVKGKGRAAEPSSPAAAPAGESESGSPPASPGTATFAGFFNKLAKDNPKLSSQFSSFQTRLASLPQNVQSTVQSTLANQNISEVQKLAEGYLAKGEDYLQGVGNELRELVNDAVKIVPPSGANTPAGRAAGEMNAMRREERRRKAQEALAASGGRRDLLVGKLRREGGVMLVDPSADAAFGAWDKQVEASGGMGGEAWMKRRQEELQGREGDDGVEAAALKASFDSVVPAKVSEDVFWTRYFFRVHQIDEEEARRRVVLGATQQADEDFTWDLEDESAHSEADVDTTPLGDSGVPLPERKTSHSTLKPAKPAPSVDTTAGARPTPLSPTESADEDWGLDESAGGSPTLSTHPGPPSSKTTATTTTARQAPLTSVEKKSPSSGRNSSEDGSGPGTVASSVAGTTSSFDVVSAQPSGDEAVGKAAAPATGKAAGGDDEDSDWE